MAGLGPGRIRRVWGQFYQNIWNRGLDADSRIVPVVSWPLLFVPILLVSQLISPSPIWMGLLVALLCLYLFAYYWIRIQIGQISLVRFHESQVLVVGDELEILSRAVNGSALPVLWCLVADQAPSRYAMMRDRVIAIANASTSEWSEKYPCHRRGRYQYGPTTLTLGDPLGLFLGRREFPAADFAVIYPRVVELPVPDLRQQSRSGSWHQRRRLQATTRAPIIREYTPSDSLRFVHWPSTAHRGELTVTEVESEPGSRMSIVLDLFAPHHVGSGRHSTLEAAIMVAGSLVAQTVNASDQRQCGLLCAERVDQAVTIAPGQGSGHMWDVLHALAALDAGEVPLHLLLAKRQLLLEAQQEDSLMVVAPYPRADVPAEAYLQWLVELEAMRTAGRACGITFIRHQSQRDQQLHGALGPLVDSFPITILEADAHYVPVITYSRQRTEYIATPFGGTTQIEVEEVVG